MSAKRIQIKHWQNSKYDTPHESTLSKFWSRAGIIKDITAMRIFRLEIQYRGYQHERIRS